MWVIYNCDKFVLYYFFVLCGEYLSLVSIVKDFGIIILYDFLWILYVVEVVNKVNKVFGLIKWIIGFVNKEIFFILYKVFVRLIFEYVFFVWCFYLVKNIVFLEKV